MTESEGRKLGIYLDEESEIEYQYKRLKSLGFQKLLGVLSVTSVKDVIALILPSEGEAVIGITEILEAVFKVMGEADENNAVIRLISISADITLKEAEEVPAEIGVSLILDLFTTTLELLTNSLNFSQAEKELIQNIAERRIATPKTEKSSDDLPTSSSDTAENPGHESTLLKVGSLK